MLIRNLSRQYIREIDEKKTLACYALLYVYFTSTKKRARERYVRKRDTSEREIRARTYSVGVFHRFW